MKKNLLVVGFYASIIFVAFPLYAGLSITILRDLEEMSPHFNSWQDAVWQIFSHWMLESWRDLLMLFKPMMILIPTAILVLTVMWAIADKCGGNPPPTSPPKQQ